MVTKSKLRLAIAAEKSIDFAKLKQDRKRKAALKRKRTKFEHVSEPTHDDEANASNDAAQVSARFARESPVSVEKEGRERAEVDVMDEAIEPECSMLHNIDDSETSDSSIDHEEITPREGLSKPGSDRGVKSDDDSDEEDIPMSDVDDLEDEYTEDLIPHTRLTINNTSALKTVLGRILMPIDNSQPFASHQCIVADTETADSVPDVSDDFQRELALYSQSLEAARLGRFKLLSERVPFSRPLDYFAEMLKEDAHMEKVKAKLVEEASAKKAAAEARKLRDLKKFGKQVQVAKLQERQKAKRETLEKIKTLKRKRQESGSGNNTKEAEMFDIAVDNEMTNHSQRASKGTTADGAARKPNAKRQKKNDKYGFGGKKRNSKSGDAVSSADLSAFDAKRMKAAGPRGRAKAAGKATRPGKARRKVMASRQSAR
ncbi:Eukaryotic rRNA processing [Ophiocordyceps camponoti-floridani]|uniref:Eukaryotic rRNA processing n=1 Tax=Ophiocordyceps camponoti-floridani TaxID=2030778 RepID=A0A8H4Q4G3_9HYPO|nr:Eukaryotic rRNA processing [Ophiocordyceps camponoti-floridani]